MSLAIANPATPFSVRQFQKALALTLALVAFGGCIYVVETYVLKLRHRFMESPSEVMMRGLGISHFLVGWMFLATSPRIRSTASLARLGFWVLIGAGWCWLFHEGGGIKQPGVMLFFYSLFLVHEIRDEADMTGAYGELPADHNPTVLFWLRTTACLGFVALLVVGYGAFGLLLRPTAMLDKTSPRDWLIGGSVLLIALGVSATKLALLSKQVHGSLDEMARAYRPLLTVYGWIAAVLSVGLFFGSAGFNLIILIHVCAWLVFSMHQLAKTAPEHARGWTWLRRTPVGFLTLHLTVAAVVLVLLGLRVHLWGRVGWVSQLTATSNFPYWSLLHIATGFWRPGR